jgi:hypothetical protein
VGAGEVVEVQEAGQKVGEEEVVMAKVARLRGFSTIAGSWARLAGNLGHD